MNTNLNSRQSHLTDEQFTDLLLGTNLPGVREHLLACEKCSREAEQVSGAINSFSVQSRLWAERRAGPSPALRSEPHQTLNWLHHPYAWTAAAFALVFAGVMGLSLRPDHARPVQQATSAVRPAAGVTPTTLQSDNDLLTAIDGELREDDSGSIGMYGLSQGSHSVRSNTSNRMSN